MKIYTVAYIKPEFIDIQINGFRKYCTDEFELIIINNGIDKDIRDQIREKCTLYHLASIEVIKSNMHYEYCSSSHMDALEYALNTVIKNDVTDINVIIDNDVFAYKEFSFKKLLNDNKLAGMYQQRGEHDYISAIFLILDGGLDLSNFTFHSGYGDTGAAVQSLMRKYNIIPEYVNHTGQIDIETNYIFRNNKKVPYEEKFRSQFIADAFIHYYRGSNWQETDVYYHQRKYKFLLNFLSHPEEYNLNLDGNVNYPTAHSDKSYNGLDHNYRNYRFNNRNMTLIELFKQKEYPTDKGTDHSYLEMYDELFKPFKEEYINILELGVWKGGSVKLWTEYFTNAKIFGYDVTTYEGDVFPKSATRVLKNVNDISLTEFETTPLMIAIDDGSHILEDQLTFIKTIHPQLLSGGILVIEDVQNIDVQKKEFDALNIPYEIIDLRGIKNRYDDVLLIFRK